MPKYNPAPKGKRKTTPPLEGYRSFKDVSAELGLRPDALRSRLRSRGISGEPHVIVRHSVAWCHPDLAFKAMDEDLELRGWVDAMELAESAGVAQQAIWGWTKRNNFKRGVDYIIRAGKRFIRGHRAEEYMRGTSPHKAVPEAPEGWRDVPWLVRETGITQSYWHRKLIEWDHIRVVQVRQGGRRLIHPDDANLIKWEYAERRAIGEWITIGELAEELDRNYSAIRYAIQKMGVESEVLKVRNQRLQRCVRPESADLIREWSRTAKRAPKSTSRTGNGYQPSASAVLKRQQASG